MSKNVIQFKKPYIFEGEEYTEVDLSCLDDLSAADLIIAERIYGSKGDVTVMPELTIGYCAQVASQATKHPIEFFNGLPAREMLKIKNRMIPIFFGDGE